MITALAEAPVDLAWEAIRQSDRPLVIERREPPVTGDALAALLGAQVREQRFDGPLACLPPKLSALPEPLRNDIMVLARRFARLMEVDSVRVRLETIVTDACRKLHADNTDVRLICTYAGEGTDHAPNPDVPDRLLRLEAGWIGLFKGRTFHPDHPPAFHRSPPIAGTGQKRLLLAIDTPLSPDIAALVPNATPLISMAAALACTHTPPIATRRSSRESESLPGSSISETATQSQQHWLLGRLA